MTTVVKWDVAWASISSADDRILDWISLCLETEVAVHVAGV